MPIFTPIRRGLISGVSAFSKLYLDVISDNRLDFAKAKLAGVLFVIALHLQVLCWQQFFVSLRTKMFSGAFTLLVLAGLIIFNLERINKKLDAIADACSSFHKTAPDYFAKVFWAGVAFLLPGNWLYGALVIAFASLPYLPALRGAWRRFNSINS